MSQETLNRRIKKRIFKIPLEFWIVWGLLIFAGLIKLWLAAGQHLEIISVSLSPYDQGMFFTLAQHILHGQWLGPYNDLTLAKGPFYPIFIAVTSYLHIPLLLAQQLLYFIASFVLVIAIQPFLNTYLPKNKKNWFIKHSRSIASIALGGLLIFNPSTTDANSSAQVIREGIYPALTLLSIALFIGLLSCVKARLWKYILIAISAGLVLSAFWLTREEGYWLYPFTLAISAYILGVIISRRHSLHDWKWRILVTVLPFLILGGSVFTVSKVNEHYYGVDSTVEFKTPQFLSAYSSLTRVQDGVWMPQVPVSIEQRKLIYQVSPAFDQLKPYLEGGLGQDWASAADMPYPYQGQVNAGGFMWDFRAAVRYAGYYKNGRTAMDYYATLASQVNGACSDGKLKCVASTDSMYPPLNKGYIKPFESILKYSFFFLIGFQQYNPVPLNPVGDTASIDQISNVTHQAITTHYGHKKIDILKYIGMVYQYIFPAFTYLAILSYVFVLVFFRPFRNHLFIVTGLLAVTVFVRMVLLSFVHVTSFPAINSLYFSSTYPLVISFDVLSLVLLAGCLLQYFRNNTKPN